MPFEVTFEDIQKYDWKNVAGSLEERDREHDRVSTRFFQKAAALREENDQVGERVFQFLAAVTSLMPRFQSREDPFGPQLIDGTRRSAALEDFSTTDAVTLAALVSETNDPELKARFADVSAALKFDHIIVRQASESYLEKAKQRESCDRWPLFIDDLERAAQLAWKLGRQKQPFVDAMEHTERLVSRFSPTDTGLCCARLLQLLQEFGQGDALAYAQLCEALAERAETNQNPLFARTYWELAADWYVRVSRDADAQRTGIRGAETHVLDAEAALQRTPPSYMVSAHHLTLAVEALRRRNAPRDRVEELHRLLLERQKRTKDEMGSHSHEMDIGPLRERARNLVSDHDLQTAIIRLTTAVSPLDLKEHRSSVEQLAKDFPFSHLFSASTVDREGRVTAHRPGMLTTDPKQYEAALWAEMVHHATTIDWPFRVQSFIEPCRWTIWREHHPRIRDLRFLISNHPFVPPGHEHSFARGFHAGFEDDWHAVAHFLVPQVEPAVRYVLDNRGVITSKLDSQLVQQVRSLEKLLLLPETIEVFGDDHVFELRSILTEEFGSNLRNRLAHGLLTDGDCYQPAVVHLWWLLIRLCVISLPPQNVPDQNRAENPSEASGEI